jgi:hypothetical protein
VGVVPPVDDPGGLPVEETDGVAELPPAPPEQATIPTIRVATQNDRRKQLYVCLWQPMQSVTGDSFDRWERNDVEIGEVDLAQ